MFKPRKVGWLDKGRRDLLEGRGGCLKYLKRSGTEQRGGDTILKREGKLGQGVGALKGLVAGAPIGTMKIVSQK